MLKKLTWALIAAALTICDAQALPFLHGAVTVSGTLYTLPANRAVNWMPGLSHAPTSGTYAPVAPPSGWTGGIPTYAQYGSTLTPSGGDDTSAINTAITNACGAASQSAPKFVQLGYGEFKTSSVLNIHCSYVYLTGMGAGPGNRGTLNTASYISANTATATMVVNTASTASQIVNIGWQPGTPSVQVNTMYETAAAASDMAAGTNSVTLSSCSSISGMGVGELVYVNELWDPALSWINQLAGQGSGYWGWGEANNNGTSVTLSRPIGQAMEVASFNSGTCVVTFTTPFSRTYRVSHSAHLGRINPTNRVVWSGVSDIFFAGPTGGSESTWGDGWAKLSIGSCAYCWISNVEVSGHGVQAASLVNFIGCFRCELRDSYLHGDSIDTTNVAPGGSFYNIELDVYTSDSLVENNISWFANKVMVMRDAGSGNVIGYNLMQDGYGYTYPSEMETGINQNHMVGTHDNLAEGNQSWQCGSESRWGSTVGMTWFRNDCTGMRFSAWPSTFISSSSCAYQNPLIGLVYNAGGGNTSYYEDAWTRNPWKGSSYSLNYNAVGNVLGYTGNPLLTSPQSTGGYNSGAQTGWQYEAFGTSTGNTSNSVPQIWAMGVPDGSEGNVTVTGSISGTTLTVSSYPSGNQTLIYPGLGITSGASGGTYITAFGSGVGETGTYTVNNSQTVGSSSLTIGYYGNGLNQEVQPNTLRDANYDYYTGQVHWHGIGGSGTGETTPPGASASGGSILPNSLYLSSKPAFFGSATWPWVDGSNASNPLPGTLPAMARFNTCAPNAISSGVSRPSYNTGTGLFVYNGKLYDSKGVAFNIQGLNIDDATSLSASAPGMVAANINAVRYNVYQYPFSLSTTVTALNTYISNDEVAIVTVQNCTTNPCVGQAGYKISGSTSTTDLNNVVSQWVSSYSSLSTTSLAKHMILNIANEWGPANSSAWASAYESAIATLRAAGFTCPIMIDSGGYGQDTGDLLNYSAAVFNSDPQKNIIFAIHPYSSAGSDISGSPNVFQQLAALSASDGMVFAVMEFGPDSTTAPGAAGGSTTAPQVINAANSAGLGWAAWAWDDPTYALPGDPYQMTVTQGVFTGTPATAASSSQLTAYGKQVVPYFATTAKATDFP